MMIARFEVKGDRLRLLASLLSLDEAKEYLSRNNARSTKFNRRSRSLA